MLAPQYPDVPIVVANLGSFWDDWRAQQQMVDILARYPNVYSDTSGVRRFDYLVEAIRKAGPHKLLFGTDGPWLHPGLERREDPASPPRAGAGGEGFGEECVAADGTASRPVRRSDSNRFIPRGSATVDLKMPRSFSFSFSPLFPQKIR